MSYVVVGARWLVGLLLALAAVAKIDDQEGLRAAIGRYRVIPAGWAPLLAYGLPYAEAVLALLVVLGTLPRIVAWLVVAMFVIFASAIALNLVRGESFECGCGTGPEPRLISWDLVARDLVLAGLAVLCALEPVPALSLLSGVRRTGTPSAVALLPVPMLVIVLLVLSRLELATHTARSWLRTGPRGRSVVAFTDAARAEPPRLLIDRRGGRGQSGSASP